MKMNHFIVSALYTALFYHLVMGATPYWPTCSDYEPCEYTKSFPCSWSGELCNSGFGTVATLKCENVPEGTTSVTLQYDVRVPDEPLYSTVIYPAGGGNIDDMMSIAVWEMTNTSSTLNQNMTNWYIAGDFTDRETAMTNGDAGICLNAPLSFGGEGQGCLLSDASTPHTFGPLARPVEGTAGNYIFARVERRGVSSERCMSVQITLSIS